MDADLQTLVTQMTGIFGDAKTGGLAIVGGAIAIGIIFICAKWLWGKTRAWLAKA